MGGGFQMVSLVRLNHGLHNSLVYMFPIRWAIGDIFATLDWRAEVKVQPYYFFLGKSGPFTLKSGCLAVSSPP